MLARRTGRVLLAHLSTPAELSRYALTAQIYAVCWQVLSTAGLAYWPIFVKRRSATEQTVRMWWHVLLTRPNEARWQALWTMAMAAVSIGLGCAAAERFGAVGVVYASALAICAAQVLPDLRWVPKLVRRRPRGAA